jgi:hypothetical protein
MCRREEIALVGGGNSAGQAAVFLSGFAAKIFMLVRADSLASSMSRYLIERIEMRPNIELLCQTEIVALTGTPVGPARKGALASCVDGGGGQSAMFFCSSASLLPERKRQFAKPSLDAVSLDVREVLPIQPWYALIQPNPRPTGYGLARPRRQGICPDGFPSRRG